MAIMIQSMPPQRGSLKPLLYCMAGMGVYGASRGIRSVLEVGERTPHVLLTHGLANGIMYANPATIVPSFRALLRRVEFELLDNDHDVSPRVYCTAFYEWNGLLCSSVL